MHRPTSLFFFSSFLSFLALKAKAHLTRIQMNFIIPEKEGKREREREREKGGLTRRRSWATSSYSSLLEDFYFSIIIANATSFPYLINTASSTLLYSISFYYLIKREKYLYRIIKNVRVKINRSIYMYVHSVTQFNRIASMDGRSRNLIYLPSRNLVVLNQYLENQVNPS